MLESTRIVDKDIKFYQAKHQSYLVKVQEVPQKETTSFYQEVHTEFLNFMFGWLLITENPMIYLHLVEFYLITNLH